MTIKIKTVLKNKNMNLCEQMNRSTKYALHGAKKLILTGFILLGTLSLWAQKYEVELQIGTQKKEMLELVNDTDGTKLLELPVTFQLINKDNLIILFGDGEELHNELSVWLFSPTMLLKDFLEKNKHVAAHKKFKKSNAELNRFYDSKGCKYISKYNFDDGYEIIKKNPKPVFFQVTDSNIELYLYFYVTTKNKKSYMNEFIAKTKPVKITIKTLKK